MTSLDPSRTEFVVRNEFPGPDQSIYVFIATYEDIRQLSDVSRQENTSARRIAENGQIVKPLEVTSDDDGAYYLALTFQAAKEPAVGVPGIIYVGKPLNPTFPASGLVREIKVPEGFRTTLIVSPDGFRMISEVTNVD